MKGRRYHQYSDDIDVDAFEEAIGFTPLRTDGANDIGHCVFPGNHKTGDSTGKFAIHRDKMVYNCFVCGGGSLLSLAMELYDFDVDEANTWLLQFAGEARTDQEFTNYLLAMLEDTEKRVATMPYFNPRVLERFSDDDSYFLTRGISREVIDTYHLCYGDNVMKPAPMKKTATGATKIDDDYWGPVAIFPHYWQLRLVGWQHRWMEWDKDHTKTPKWLAKYTNTTDFPKSNTLYNYDYALKAKGPVIICESVVTALFLRSFDIPAVSYFGSEPNDAQLRLMRRFVHGVILAPDNDANGDRLLTATTPYLERFIPVQHCDKVKDKPGSDLGDFAAYPEPYRELKSHLKYHVHTPGFGL